jgi:hypothetical protein
MVYVIADPEPVVSTSVVCGVTEAGERDQRTPKRWAGQADRDVAANLLDHELVNGPIFG